jgi:hypothetical protein
MAQVIIYTNDNGGVSVCVPTGELSIEQVLEKDCPQNAIIVDESALPNDKEYSNAWELINGTVVINQTKKQIIIDKAQAKISNKTSALSKLSVLGLTEDEIKSLVG